MYLTEIEATCAGIPCRIAVLNWEPFRAGRYSGAPENCYPDEGGYGDWVVLDRRGNPAPWLANKITRAEADRIDRVVFDRMEKGELR